jgi:beta-phosphoglucomutase-like phosphatase (HAD superfamily)
VRGDQVARGKPAPDVFLEASRRLDVPPERCVVFEDAPMGIVAAKAAGMRVVAIASSFSAAQFMTLADPPDLTCRDFEAFEALALW